MGPWTRRGILLVAFTLSACATMGEGVPVAEIDKAKSAVYEAKAAKANELAESDLRVAQDKLIKAQALVMIQRRGRYPEARRLAQEAAVDAAVAEARAKLETVRSELAARSERPAGGEQ